MDPSSSRETSTGADLGLDRVQPTLIIWCDWKGDLYAFCSRQCQRHYQAWLCDPAYPFEKATWADASFGCVWCGGDLTQGVLWLSQEQPTDPEAAHPS